MGVAKVTYATRLLSDWSDTCTAEVESARRTSLTRINRSFKQLFTRLPGVDGHSLSATIAYQDGL